jgi:hypothetical protein
MPPKGTGRFARRPSVADDRPKDDRPLAPAPPAIEPVAVEPAPETKSDRISVPLKPDGSIDWDAMRPTTQERIRKAIGAAPASAAPSGLATPALVRALVSSVSSIAVGVAVMTGHTIESSQGLRLREEAVAELVPLWEAAINDYGAFLGRHQNLIVAAAATGLAFLPGIQGLQRAPKPQGISKTH